MSALQIKNAIICDDVRREHNGKEILIGVYSGGIVVAQFPAQLVLSCWIQYYCDEISTREVELKISGGEDVTFVEAKVFLQTLRPGCGSIAFGQFPIGFQVPTNLMVSLREQGQEWRSILEVPVAKNPGATPGQAPVHLPT